MGRNIAGAGGLALALALAGIGVAPGGPADAVAEEGQRSPNPLSGNPEAEAAGKTIYRANCAYCHGMSADGRGRGLPNSADLRKFKRGYTRFVTTVKEGYKTMPPWGAMGELTDTEIDQVGAYLETVAGRRANWNDPDENSDLRAPDPLLILAASHEEAPPAPKEYEAHLGHILTSWADTPGQVGLIAILEEELAIAVAHAGYAAMDLENLENIRLHTDHVRHAVDPASVRSGQGPGRGYGLRRATQGVLDHLGYAAAAADASESLKLHAEHVAASANNVLFWAGKILDKAAQITGGASPIVSAFFAEEIVEHLQWIAEGRDANGDGATSWEDGEGGLAQMKAHLGYIE